MKVNDLVNHRRRALKDQRHQRGILALWLIFPKVAGSHLSSLTRHFQQAVLMNPPVETLRKPQRLKFPEPLNVLHHMP